MKSLMFWLLALVLTVLAGCGGNGIGGTVTDPGHSGSYTID